MKIEDTRACRRLRQIRDETGSYPKELRVSKEELQEFRAALRARAYSELPLDDDMMYEGIPLVLDLPNTEETCTVMDSMPLASMLRSVFAGIIDGVVDRELELGGNRDDLCVNVMIIPTKHGPYVLRAMPLKDE